MVQERSGETGDDTITCLSCFGVKDMRSVAREKEEHKRHEEEGQH